MAEGIPPDVGEMLRRASEAAVEDLGHIEKLQMWIQRSEEDAGAGGERMKDEKKARDG